MHEPDGLADVGAATDDADMALMPDGHGLPHPAARWPHAGLVTTTSAFCSTPRHPDADGSNRGGGELIDTTMRFSPGASGTYAHQVGAVSQFQERGASQLFPVVVFVHVS